MKFGMVNKLTTVNRFFFILHTVSNITHFGVITREINIKINILKGVGGLERSLEFVLGRILSASKKGLPKVELFVFDFYQKTMLACFLLSVDF